MMGHFLLDLCGLVGGLIAVILLCWWDRDEDLGFVTKGWQRSYWRRKGVDDECE